MFTATKRDADTIADRLNIAGFSAAALHGDMHQGARNRTLDSLRRGQVKVLVATDVAARGIDVPNITHVFNYDLPKFPEDYVHRIGRTGRAGRNGLAISLVNHAEGMNVKRIERFTKQLIPVNVDRRLRAKAHRLGATFGSASRQLEAGRQPFGAAKPGQRTFSKPNAPRSEATAAATRVRTHVRPTAHAARTATVNRLCSDQKTATSVAVFFRPSGTLSHSPAPTPKDSP